MIVEMAVTGVLALGAGVAVGYVIRRMTAKTQAQDVQTALKDAEQKVARAQAEADGKAREALQGERQAFENESRDLRKEIAEQQKRIAKREDVLDSKLSLLDKKESSLEKTQQQLEEMRVQNEREKGELAKAREVQMQELQRVGRFTREEARAEILKRVEEEVRFEAAKLVERYVERAKAEAHEKSRAIVLDSIHRMATDFVAESVVSTIDLPGDEMKGRIIGREGRNIRAFEKATGIDVIVDDTPGVIVISGFDPVRREVARLSMLKLIQDGRIHPARIEDLVKKTEGEINKDIDETGRKVVQDFGLHNINAKLVRLLGRLKYRTSYGQNCLQHSIEVAHVSSLLAEELKLDTVLAARAGLLHDIGKAIDHEVEGTHPSIGADLVKHADEKPEIVNAVEAHHEDVPVTSLYAVIVQTADAISAARPGARRESLEKYVKRLEKLESIATSHPGVEKAYAIQAGRELRVLAKAEQLDEAQSAELARVIAKQIEDELNYPGEVKVTLIREARFVEYAR
jgi:ribonuclease Y